LRHFETRRQKNQAFAGMNDAQPREETPRTAGESAAPAHSAPSPSRARYNFVEARAQIFYSL